MKLDDLKRDFEKYKYKMKQESAKLNDYKGKARELDNLYKRMKVKKDEMKEEQRSIKSYSNKSYQYFKGRIFGNKYQQACISLAYNEYGRTIDIIDENLDAINRKRTYYENLVYKSEDTIGSIKASLNSIATTIENWVN